MRICRIIEIGKILQIIRVEERGTLYLCKMKHFILYGNLLQNTNIPNHTVTFQNTILCIILRIMS